VAVISHIIALPVWRL